MDGRRTAVDTYAGGVGEFGGTPEARGRLQGNIEELRSGSLRVRVYSGVDILTGRELYLKQVVPAGPRAWQRAEKVREDLVRQVEEGRQPRTNATVAQLVWRHLAMSEVEPRTRDSLTGYVRKHVEPLIGQVRLAHERIAATLHARWKTGALRPGVEITVRGLAQEHHVSVGTARSALALLDQLGVVHVRIGRRTTVRPRPSATDETAPATIASPSSAPPIPDWSGGDEGVATTLLPVSLELLHLGTRVRALTAHADPDDIPTLQKLLLDAVRRLGVNRSDIGDYELAVYLPGTDGPVTTIVAAA